MSERGVDSKSSITDSLIHVLVPVAATPADEVSLWFQDTDWIRSIL